MDLFEDPLFKNDPMYMKSLIGKAVQITTIKDEEYIGTVYVIDPIYKTLVLHTKEKTDPQKVNIILILYHAIQCLSILPDPADESYLASKEDPILNNQESINEKMRLKKWLQKMYINVEEAGDYLRIDDHLLIMPPYGLGNCICSNTIILDKIRNIISLMPLDFK